MHLNWHAHKACQPHHEPDTGEFHLLLSFVFFAGLWGLCGVSSALRTPLKKRSSAPGSSSIFFMGFFAMSDSDSAEYEEWRTKLTEHARAIGYVCIDWAWLELAVDAFVAQLMGLPIGSIEHRVSSASTDFRAKLEILKALAHEKQLSADWFVEVEKVVNAIDNDIRPLRNRVVHDLWHAGKDGSPTRAFSRNKLARPQSHAPLELSTFEICPMTSDQVEEISKKIARATNQILDLQAMMPAYPFRAAIST